MRTVGIAVCLCVPLLGFSLPAPAGPLTPGALIVADSGRIDVSSSPVNYNEGAVFSIDPNTGDRTLISGRGVGAGPELNGTSSVALTPDGYLVATSVVYDAPNDAFLGRLIRIDPATGNRSILTSYEDSPDAYSIHTWCRLHTTPQGELLALDYHQTRIDPVATSPRGAIHKIDLATGARTMLASKDIGSGPALHELFGIDTLPNGDWLVVDVSLNHLLRVDFNSGNRTIVSSNDLGAGTPFDFTFDISLLDSTHAVVTSVDSKELISVDLLTGDRTLLSGGSVGMGVEFDYPMGITRGSDRRLFVTMYPDIYERSIGAIAVVDSLTGNRALLSGKGVGSGPELIGPGYMIFVPVPEPATWWLLMMGVATLLAAAHHQRS